jgi:hypothetical protein
MKLLPMAVGVAAAPLGTRRPFARRLVVGLGDAVLGLLCCAVVLVVCRRLAGALHAPASPTTLLAVGILAASLCAAFRLTPRDGRRWQQRLLAAVPTVTLFALGIALSIPGVRLVALVALWGPMLAEEGWAVWRGYHPTRRATPTPARVPAPMSSVAAAVAVVPPTDADVTQQFVRSRAADGSETLSGWLRLCFAAGQRQTTAHLAFCPPFAQTPTLNVIQVTGPAARVKTAQVLPYGARLEIKLAVPAGQSVALRLQFTARASLVPVSAP